MYIKILSLTSLGLGILLLMQVAIPFLSFQLWEITFYQQNQTLINPRPQSQVLGLSVQNIGDFPAIVSSQTRENLPYQTFYLTIPKIKLADVKVAVYANNFDYNLAQLPGSALPGERGNVFITGHSSLVQLYRPDNYKAIFAHLPEIGKNDQILVTTLNQQFTYTVMGLKIIDPKETWVVEPPDSSGRYLTLMTCVPPGFSTKRLIVLAKLQE